MTPRTFLATAAAVFLLETAGFAQTTQTITFNVAGKTRSGVVHVPSGTSKPCEFTISPSHSSVSVMLSGSSW